MRGQEAVSATVVCGGQIWRREEFAAGSPCGARLSRTWSRKVGDSLILLPAQLLFCLSPTLPAQLQCQACSPESQSFSCALSQSCCQFHVKGSLWAPMSSLDRNLSRVSSGLCSSSNSLFLDNSWHMIEVQVAVIGLKMKQRWIPLLRGFFLCSSVTWWIDLILTTIL